MDLRQYFRKMREIESNIPDPHVFVTSVETGDGGKAGVVTEVPRDIAARMITEGRALLSTRVERERFLETQKIAREAALRADLAQKLQVTVVAENEPQRAGTFEPTSKPAAKK